VSLCLLVGSAAISGGTYVIAQHAAAIARSGLNVTLAIQEPFTTETLRWHDELPALRCIPFAQALNEKFDLVVATWWKTALELPAFKAKRHGYFVQSIESRFYPDSEGPLRALINATYSLPVPVVTEATWIREELSRSYGQSPALVRNGIRKDVYNADGAVINDERPRGLRVLVEGHFGVRFKNTALGIKLSREAGIRDIWLLTGSPVSKLPGVSRVFSRVPMMETGPIYRSCDVLVKLSTVEGMFGPPLEMFHCGGTAVVFDVTGHDEYIRDGFNARVVRHRSCDGVVRALRQLRDSAEELGGLRKGALETASSWPSWEQSSPLFVEWVRSVLAGPETNIEACSCIIAEAWRQYDTDERERLQRNPMIVRRYKLSAMTAKLPPLILRGMKQAEAIGEVLFGPRVVR
jgi:hypothetical protein